MTTDYPITRQVFLLEISEEELDAIIDSFPRPSKSESIRDAAFSGIASIGTARIERKPNA